MENTNDSNDDLNKNENTYTIFFKQNYIAH